MHMEDTRTAYKIFVYICVCVCVCVSCTWKIQEMPTKYLVRRLARKTKTYMGG